METQKTSQQHQQDEHHAARPLKFVKDDEGNGWLCDQNVDPHRNLKLQGCWSCGEIAFPDGGR